MKKQRTHGEGYPLLTMWARTFSFSPFGAIPIRTGTPTAREASAHGSIGKLELPAQIGAVCQQRGHCRADIAAVPGQCRVNIVGVFRVTFERAHVSNLLWLPQ